MSLSGCCALDAVRIRQVHAMLGRAYYTQAFCRWATVAQPDWVSCSGCACCNCCRSTYQCRQSVRLPPAEVGAEQCGALLQVHVHPPLAALLPGSQHHVRWAGLWASTVKHKPVLLPLAVVAPHRARAWLSLIWANAHGWQDSCSSAHLLCTAAPRFKHAAVRPLKCPL